MADQPRPGVRPKKRARDRLIRLASLHPDYVLGFLDEVWWSRFAQPALHAWSPTDQPLRLVEQTVAQEEDSDPKALACYGLLRADREQVWLRFVDGRPVSALTTQFLAWCLARLAQEGKRALLLVWDNAGWHVSKAVRAWIRAQNREVKRTGQGVRLIACYLPTKSPWLNNIEPHWMHSKRHVVEPDRLLSARELIDRICAYFGCAHEPHLSIPEQVA
ncbi:MAG TPA: transposase [bacterium]|nr:transposase [bacterium]